MGKLNICLRFCVVLGLHGKHVPGYQQLCTVVIGNTQKICSGISDCNFKIIDTYTRARFSGVSPSSRREFICASTKSLSEFGSSSKRSVWYDPLSSSSQACTPAHFKRLRRHSTGSPVNMLTIAWESLSPVPPRHES